MNRFGKEAVRRYLAYCGTPTFVAIRESSVPSDEPQESLSGFSTVDLISGLERFFDDHLGPEWVAPPSPDFISALSAPGSDRAGGKPRVIIGLTGERECGKSVIGDHLVNDLGFIRLHPFGPGKALLRGYYETLGASPSESMAMTDGDLKNTPCRLLPVLPETGEHASSRWLMERLGRHMAQEMGMEWTIGAEIRHHEGSDPEAGLLVESVVYEERVLRDMGGVIIRMSRHPEARSGEAAIGEISDHFVNSITHDAEVINRMDGKDRLIADFDEVLNGILSIRSDEPGGP